MNAILLYVLLFVTWLLLTFNLTVPNIVVGGAAALLVTVLFARYSLKVKARVFQPHRYFWAIVYVFIFLWECIMANLDVAYRVLHPGLPIKPGIVKVKTNLVTDTGKALLANSITMTPGTITVDILDDSLYIHWIYVRSKDPEVYTHAIAGMFEKYIKRIFE
jgi:multicomponent Na+:H+ antiporter subunit E